MTKKISVRIHPDHLRKMARKLSKDIFMVRDGSGRKAHSLQLRDGMDQDMKVRWYKDGLEGRLGKLLADELGVL